MSRIILKISGEALKGKDKNICNDKLDIIYKTINILKKYNHQIALVIGGGNFFRGRENIHMDETTRDTIGMLGTIINALYLKDYLEKNNLNVFVSTPFNFPGLIENISDEILKKQFDLGNIVIFGGGVGKSGFSTDSGVVLAAEKLDGNLIIKMTNVDGVYDSDPKLNKMAKKFDRLTYQDILENEYKVMDMYAIKKCLENNIKLLVINMNKYEELNKYFNGKLIGTEVYNEKR